MSSRLRHSVHSLSPALRAVHLMLVLGVLATTARSRAVGQTPRGRISGRVSDKATTQPVRGARVALSPNGQTVTTDSAGRYTFESDAGHYRILVRALPYAPSEASVIIIGGASVERNFVLDSSRFASPAQQLDPVAVDAERPDYRLADFERRRKTGRGMYLDDDEIRRSTASNLQDLTHGMPGIDLQCGGGPGGCRIHMLRAPMGCDPEYVVDNQVDNNFGPRTPIRDIVALEVYSGPADVPGEFAGRNAGCGVIVIWTRSGPVRPLKP